MVRKTCSKTASVVPQDSTDPAPSDAQPLANEGLEVKKQGRDNTGDVENAPAKKAKQSDILAPAPARKRSPLPKCQGRNEDPVGKRAKATRVAATKAAREAKEADKQKRADEASAAKEKLTEMEVNESFIREQEYQGRIRRQSDMAAGAGDGNESESQSEFASLNQKEFSGDESGDEPDTLRKKSGATGNKKARPKLRDEVAAKKKIIKGKTASGNKSDRPVASGFRNEAWLQARRSKEKAATTNTVDETMDDEAALSTRPDFPLSPKIDRNQVQANLAKATQRNPKRKNALISLGDSDDSDSLIVPCWQTTKASRIPSTGEGKQITKPVKQGINKPPRKKTTQQTRRVSDASSVTLDLDSPSPVDAGRNAIMPKGGNQNSLLPSILLSQKAQYLSTLLSALYASEEPFNDFMKTSPSFLKVSRTAFKSVWPHLKIKVETDDVLFNIGYQRLIERRGKIHDAVKSSIQNHFSTENFSPTEIVNWVKWFCSTHGSPIFYETPVPQDGTWDANDPDYEKPRGFLKSKFLINIGSRFLQDRDDMAFDFGPPRGLFVLILTAYEKVIRSYKTGTHIPLGDFRAKSCNNWIRQYNKNFDKKTADWWDAVLRHYAVEPDSEHHEVCDVSILDEERGVLPMSSSP